MPCRTQIFAAAIVLFAGISFLEAQDPAKGTAIAFSEGRKALRAGTLVVANPKPAKDAESDPRPVDRIWFKVTDEKSKVIEKDNKGADKDKKEKDKKEKDKDKKGAEKDKKNVEKPKTGTAEKYTKVDKTGNIQLTNVSQILFGVSDGPNPDLIVDTTGIGRACAVESSFVVSVGDAGKFERTIQCTADKRVLTLLLVNFKTSAENAQTAKKSGKDPHWIAPLGDCETADKTRYALHHPFWNEPMIRRVSNTGECCKVPKLCSLQECADEDKLFSYYKRFEKSATFPQVRFGPDAEYIETPGVIIYEGMQLLVLTDGRYELAFNASTPRSPVTMRLTVNVVFKKCHEPLQLTIPAIALVPEYRSGDSYGMGMSPSNNYQENWHVRHVGYSQVLRDRLHDGDGIEYLSRDGVARFGTLPLAR